VSDNFARSLISESESFLVFSLLNLQFIIYNGKMMGLAFILNAYNSIMIVIRIRYFSNLVRSGEYVW
jgi:hypothetical protein